MSSHFTIFKVSAEFIMDVAKVVASSPYPLKVEDVIVSLKKSKGYVTSALNQCLQLGFVCIQKDGYVSSNRYRDLIKRSERSQLFVPLREALQKYPPFLLYVDFITKGYSSEKSANITKGIFRIQSSEKVVENNLRSWALYAKLVNIDENGNLSIPEAEKGLPSEYLETLVKALRADLQAKLFLIETMSQQAFAYLSEKDVGIDELTEALLKYETESKTSANKATQTFEHFLFKVGEDIGAEVTKRNGIIEYVEAIRSIKKEAILTNQLHICHGIGALRNMSHHSPDKETGKEWVFTPQGAIISSLIVPTLMRSLYLSWKEQKQEF